MNRSWYRVALFIAAVSLAAAACSSSNSQSPTASNTGSGGIDYSKLSLAFAGGGDKVGSYKITSDGLVNDAKQLGINVSRYDNSLDGPTAVSNARLIAQNRPDVALDWNTIDGVAGAISTIFKQANVKCLAVAVAISGCNLLAVDHKPVGIEAGDIMAADAKKRGWTAANTTIVISSLNAAGTDTTDVTRYFYIEAAKDLGGFKTVAPSGINPSTTTIGGTNGIQIDCGTGLDESNTAMRNALRNIPSRNNVLLFGNDDECAEGAYQALKQGGFANRVMVGGNSAAPFAVTALRSDSNWVCENTLFIQDWGPYILSMAVALAGGKSLPARTDAPSSVLTKETLAKYYNADGSIKLLPPLVASNKYLMQYHILQRFAKVEGLN